MLSWMVPTPKDCAMLGSAVAITVPSSVSMKKAAATINAISVGRSEGASAGADSVLLDSIIPGRQGPPPMRTKRLNGVRLTRCPDIVPKAARLRRLVKERQCADAQTVNGAEQRRSV